MIESSVVIIVFQIAILVMSVVIHEVSHGFVAYLLGDSTAKYAGRLTLNPINHLDPFGSVILPAFLALVGGPIIGWARPVPYNPYNLSNQKWGPGLVAAAGPLSNIFVAIVFGVLLRVIPITSAFAASLNIFFTMIIFINVLLAIFNLVPIPPLDGSKVFFSLLPYRYQYIEQFLNTYGFILLIVFILWLFPVIFPVIDWVFTLIAGTGISL